MRTCKKCNIEKELSKFMKDKTCSNGISYTCMVCRNEYRQKLRQKNKEKIRLQNREQYLKNQESNKERSREYSKNNSDKVRIYRKKYYVANKETLLSNKKTWRQENKEQRRVYKRDYESEKRKSNPVYKFSLICRSRIKQAFKRNSLKAPQTEKLLGCKVQEAMKYLETLFQPGMTWMNNSVYGWHVDHIIPLSSAKSEEQLIKLCHYTNLQPLWAEDNLKKSNR